MHLKFIICSIHLAWQKERSIVLRQKMYQDAFKILVDALQQVNPLHLVLTAFAVLPGK